MLIASPEGQAHRRRSAVSPTFATGKISRGSHPQIRKKANRKLTAMNIAKSPCRRDSISHSVLVKQQVQLYVYKDGAKTVEMRTQPRAPLHIPAPAMERPRTSESAPVRGSNGCVRCARKSDPMNDNATTLSASLWQRAVPTDEEAPRREPMIGSTAIPRVEYGGESHCASPTTSGAFTLPKRCQRLLTPNCDWIMMWTYK